MHLRTKEKLKKQITTSFLNGPLKNLGKQLCAESFADLYSPISSLLDTLDLRDDVKPEDIQK